MARKRAQEIDELRQFFVPHAEEKVCYECNKTFAWYGKDWVYQRRKHNGKREYACSYKCWRAEDHRKEAKGKSLLRGGNYAGLY